jgi:hypothetical protein
VFLPEVKLDLPVSAKFEWAATDRTGGEQAASPRRRAAALGLRRARHSVTEWLWLDQCSLAYEWRVLRPPQVEGLLPQIRQRAELGLSAAKDLRSEGEGEGLLSTRELGTRVHECLELGNYDELEALEREVGSDRLNAKKIRSWAESSAWMQGHQPELGRWVWSELAFELEIQDEVLVGAMDRVILEERSDAAREPFFTILDFKVSAQEKTPHELLKRYGTQMVWYAYALGRLDSRAWGRTRAHLVQISSQGVVTVEVPLPDSPQSNESNELQAWAEAQAFKVARVIRGERGTASPSELCGVCEFRKICPS